MNRLQAKGVSLPLESFSGGTQDLRSISSKKTLPMNWRLGKSHPQNGKIVFQHSASVHALDVRMDGI